MWSNRIHGKTSGRDSKNEIKWKTRPLIIVMCVYRSAVFHFLPLHTSPRFSGGWETFPSSRSVRHSFPKRKIIHIYFGSFYILIHTLFLFYVVFRSIAPLYFPSYCLTVLGFWHINEMSALCVCVFLMMMTTLAAISFRHLLANDYNKIKKTTLKYQHDDDNERYILQWWHIRTQQIFKSSNEKREYAENYSIRTLCGSMTAYKRKTIIILYLICKLLWFSFFSLPQLSVFIVHSIFSLLVCLFLGSIQV